MSDEFHLVPCMARFDTVDTDRITVRCVACPAPVEVVHGETCIAGDLVQTLTARDSLLNHVLVTKDFVVCREQRKH